MKKLLLLVCMLVMMSTGTCLAFIPTNNPEPVLCVDAVSADKKRNDNMVVYLKRDAGKYEVLFFEGYRVEIVGAAFSEETGKLAVDLSVQWYSSDERKGKRDMERLEKFVLERGETKEIDVNGLKISSAFFMANRPNGAMIW